VRSESVHTGIEIETSQNRAIFLLKILFVFRTKRDTLMRRSTVLSFPVQLVFPEAVFLVVCDPSMNDL
jgi:hypothetical protein